MVTIKIPLPIALDTKEMTERLQAGGFMITVFNIEVDGESHRVLAKDYQRDPVRDFLQHIDFFRITKGATLVVEIPVHFENEEESPGISRGGVLNVVRHTIEVECRASEIPEGIMADLTGLDIGDSLNISAITLPDGRPNQPSKIVTSLSLPSLHQQYWAKSPTEGEEVDVDVDDVEVIGEAKDEDEEGGKE